MRSLWLGHGTVDFGTSYEASRAWFNAQTGLEDKTFKTYEGWYHQLHAEPGRDEFLPGRGRLDLGEVWEGGRGRRGRGGSRGGCREVVMFVASHVVKARHLIMYLVPEVFNQFLFSLPTGPHVKIPRLLLVPESIGATICRTKQLSQLQLFHRALRQESSKRYHANMEVSRDSAASSWCRLGNHLFQLGQVE